MKYMYEGDQTQESSDDSTERGCDLDIAKEMIKMDKQYELRESRRLFGIDKEEMKSTTNDETTPSLTPDEVCKILGYPPNTLDFIPPMSTDINIPADIWSKCYDYHARRVYGRNGGGNKAKATETKAWACHFRRIEEDGYSIWLQCQKHLVQ
jgi:hypothetical protein